MDTGSRGLYGQRARGAQVTDIVVLVVAADDVSCPRPSRRSTTPRRQTPIIVAMNKMDNMKSIPTAWRIVEQPRSEEWGGYDDRSRFRKDGRDRRASDAISSGGNPRTSGQSRPSGQGYDYRSQAG
ncbi:MAG: hypothetical protein ACLRSW_07015 [Christensenellaceae bacterium]